MDGQDKDMYSIDNILLVIENVKGMETNKLLTYEELKKQHLSRLPMPTGDLFDLIKDIGRTFHNKDCGFETAYYAPNNSVSVRYCYDNKQLNKFMEGGFNDTSTYRFSREESSKECIKAVENLTLNKMQRNDSDEQRITCKKSRFR